MARATKPHIGNPRQWLKDEVEPTSNITFTRVHPAQEFEIDVCVGWGGSGGDRAQDIKTKEGETQEQTQNAFETEVNSIEIKDTVNSTEQIENTKKTPINPIQTIKILCCDLFQYSLPLFLVYFLQNLALSWLISKAVWFSSIVFCCCVCYDNF